MPSDTDRPETHRSGPVGQLALAAVMAVTLLPPGLKSVHVGGVSVAWSVALVAALLALHVGVATARWWPRASFTVGTLACAVLLLSPDIEGVTGFEEGGDYSAILMPSTLCFFVLLHAVSAAARPPWPNLALAVGLTGGVLTLVRLWGFTGTPIDTWAWWLLLGTTMFGGAVGAWALGRYRVTRAAWTQQLAERAAADERRRIAREMHDVVAHSLAVMVSHAEAGRLVVPGDPDRAPEILTTIADTGREALVEMRGLLGVLRDDDAATEPQPGLADLPALVERVRASGVPVELSVDDALRPPPAVGLTVYRVVQEALTNVARHAGTRPTAQVSVAGVDGELRVRVVDDGHPVEPSRSGRGLVGMRERVDAVGGTMTAGTAEDGWTVDVRIPT